MNRRKEIIKIRAEINEIEYLKNNTKDQWTQELALWKYNKEPKAFTQSSIPLISESVIYVCLYEMNTLNRLNHFIVANVIPVSTSYISYL